MIWDNIKKYVWGTIVAIFGILLAILYAMSNKITGLNSKVGELQGEKDIRKEVEAYDKAKDTSNDSETDYAKLRDALLKSEHDDGSNKA